MSFLKMEIKVQRENVPLKIISLLNRIDLDTDLGFQERAIRN